MTSDIQEGDYLSGKPRRVRVFEERSKLGAFRIWVFNRYEFVNIHNSFLVGELRILNRTHSFFPCIGKKQKLRSGKTVVRRVGFGKLYIYQGERGRSKNDNIDLPLFERKR